MLVGVCYEFCINYLFISFILVKLSINSFTVSCLNSSHCMEISSLSTNSCCGGNGFSWKQTFWKIEKSVIWYYAKTNIKYVISAYHHYRCEFESRSWGGVLDTTLCDTFVSDLRHGRWFSSGTPVSITQKILLKVASSPISSMNKTLH